MFASLRPDMATGLDTALGEELDADYWPSTALFLSSIAPSRRWRKVASPPCSSTRPRSPLAIITRSWLWASAPVAARGASLADSVRGPEGHPGGDRRRQVLMLAILTADPALHLAARRNYLTGPLFWRIVAR